MDFGAVISGKHDDHHGEEKMTLGRSTMMTGMPHGRGFNVFSYSDQ